VPHATQRRPASVSDRSEDSRREREGAVLRNAGADADRSGETRRPRGGAGDDLLRRTARRKTHRAVSGADRRFGSGRNHRTPNSGDRGTDPPSAGAVGVVSSAMERAAEMGG